MKKAKYFTVAIICVVLLSAGAVAQEESVRPSVPRYVSEKGYWVVESNINHPKQYTIRFYNNNDVVVYTEQLNGVELKLHKRKVKMNLKKVLESCLVAWEKQHEATENEGWVYQAVERTKK